MANLVSRLTLSFSKMEQVNPLICVTIAVAVSLLFASRFLGSHTPTAPHNDLRKSGQSQDDVIRQPPLPGHVKVTKILVHPIKSCRGTSVESARYTPEGMENDRKWCIVDANTHTVITARAVSKMVLITPRIELDSTSPYSGVLTVSFPEESECESFSTPLQPTAELLQNWKTLPKVTIWPTEPPTDGFICESVSGTSPSPSSILSKFFGKDVLLLFKGPRPRALEPTSNFPDLKGTALYQDGYPLLVVSAESIEELNKKILPYVGTQGIDEQWKTDKVVVERFRPNIVMSGGGAFADDFWEEIVIGSETASTITLVKRCTRCLLPNVSPKSGEKDKAVPYKVMMKFRTGLDPKEKRSPCMGCNAVPQGNGIVKVGDTVFVKKMIK